MERERSSEDLLCYRLRDEQAARASGSILSRLRCRIFDFSAVVLCGYTFGIGTPRGRLCGSSVSHQEVPDYFAGPAMAKTSTQETRAVFGPEQEEWKAAISGRATILREVWESMRWFPGVDVGTSGDTYLKDLCLVVKPNPEGEKGQEEGTDCGLW